MKYLILVTLLTLAGCVAPYGPNDSSLKGIYYNESVRLDRECRAYYHFRRPELAWPKPADICEAITRLAREGKNIPHWRL